MFACWEDCLGCGTAYWISTPLQAPVAERKIQSFWRLDSGHNWLQHKLKKKQKTKQKQKKVVTTMPMTMMMMMTMMTLMMMMTMMTMRMTMRMTMMMNKKNKQLDW
jgi:hypothetical protein